MWRPQVVYHVTAVCSLLLLLSQSSNASEGNSISHAGVLDSVIKPHSQQHGLRREEGPLEGSQALVEQQARGGANQSDEDVELESSELNAGTETTPSEHSNEEIGQALERFLTVEREALEELQEQLDASYEGEKPSGTANFLQANNVETPLEVSNTQAELPGHNTSADRFDGTQGEEEQEEQTLESRRHAGSRFKRFIDKARDSAKHALKKLKAEGHNLAENVEDMAHDAKKGLRNAWEKTSDAVKRGLKGAKSRLTDTVSRIRDKMHNEGKEGANATDEESGLTHSTAEN
ncbi:uncharacterized protein LOC34621786 [Cyclospora cayetanensis]|uniref:Uncharacterized protein n=2 Tax=Cyclospora cayetanensis TaxID=88456 RepID=A0A1D3CXH7_9EIME|nr:uncharacterized protein LOC34621786 [Cyclospora cayetanensis]OEH75898.1 hypothetical protein cyc_05433 [Cyclospora cayetanensis]